MFSFHIPDRLLPFLPCVISLLYTSAWFHSIRTVPAGPSSSSELSEPVTYQLQERTDKPVKLQATKHHKPETDSLHSYPYFNASVSSLHSFAFVMSVVLCRFMYFLSTVLHVLHLLVLFTLYLLYSGKFNAHVIYSVYFIFPLFYNNLYFINAPCI